MKCKVATLLLDWQAEVDITSTLLFLHFTALRTKHRLVQCAATLTTTQSSAQTPTSVPATLMPAVENYHLAAAGKTRNRLAPFTTWVGRPHTEEIRSDT